MFPSSIHSFWWRSNGSVVVLSSRSRFAGRVDASESSIVTKKVPENKLDRTTSNMDEMKHLTNVDLIAIHQRR